MIKKQLPHPAYKFKSALFIISVAALIAGTLNICVGILMYAAATRQGPALIFKYIASAVFGEAAFLGGKKMILIGFFFHFLIAFIFSFFLFIIYRTLKRLLGGKIIIGITYGFFMWLSMNFIVLPLSYTPDNTITLSKATEGIIVIILTVALPLSFIFYKYFYFDHRNGRRMSQKGKRGGEENLKT